MDLQGKLAGKGALYLAVGSFEQPSRGTAPGRPNPKRFGPALARYLRVRCHKLRQAHVPPLPLSTIGAMLGNKASGIAKSMGIDSAFSAMDSLTQTDAERRAKEQEQGAQSEAGAIKLKDMLKMPHALKVSCLLAPRSCSRSRSFSRSCLRSRSPHKPTHYHLFDDG